VPAIESLLNLCGESPVVRKFVRKQHVDLLKSPVPIAALKKGDAVVAFSRREVLMLRDQIAAVGHPVSVVYGALPPRCAGARPSASPPASRTSWWPPTPSAWA
jgi:ATP-dependent RNA helicase SUPV3L1/SUV3